MMARPQREPNPNPLVEEIMQAYLKTMMTERQFESLVEQSLTEAKTSGGSGDVQAAYDKGFSDGYDSATAEGFR